MRRAAALAVVAALAACGSTSPSANVPVDGTAAGAPSAIVSVSWLQAHLGAVQIVDVRSQTSYDAGHIPGARYLDVSSLVTKVDGVPGQVVPESTGAPLLAAAGLTRREPIVVYSGGVDTGSARTAWTLDYYGQGAFLLDGGFRAWTAAGLPTSTATPGAKGSFLAEAPAPKTRVDASWVLAHLDDPSVAIVDARTPTEYAAGHIPGAINVNWTENVSAGALLSRKTVAALYSAIAPGETVVTYCTTGFRGSVAFNVVRWLGFADVRLYDGSWAEWGSRSDLPKATGSGM